MKILYVKNNSERANSFQIKTIIYQENGKKYVKKQAMHKDAIPHLMSMKQNAQLLTSSIINPKIKIVKIIDESSDSLTFEYIDGVSLEYKYNAAKTLEEKSKLIEMYILLLKEGFKTTPFESETMATDAFKELLGDFDYTECNQQLCFNGVSNIDLLFSNIIFKNDDIYIIDYEWVFNLNIPIEFIIYRMLHKPNNLHTKMEDYFISNTVINTMGFFRIQNQYAKKRQSSIPTLIANQEHKIEELNHTVEYWIHVANTRTLKGRFKKVLKLIFPLSILQKLKAIKNDISLEVTT